MPMHATMSNFRKIYEGGLADVRKALSDKRCTIDEAEAAFKDYRIILGIIDSMTPAERENPMEAIDSESIRRLAVNAGGTDQNVIRFMINWDDYVENIARANLGELGEDG